MNRFPIILIVLISIVALLFYSTQNTESVDNDKKIVELNNPPEAINDEELVYSFDEHPCLCLTEGSLPASTLSPQYYKETKYLNDENNFNELDMFHILIESSILFNHYSEFMRTLEPIILRKKINDYFNPKYYFILALRNLYQREYKDAESNLRDFISIKNKYESDNEIYFQLGCYEKDIDWILNLENLKIYQISNILLDYATSKTSKETINISIGKTINELKNLYDETPNKYDLIENIIFILDARELACSLFNCLFNI